MKFCSESLKGKPLIETNSAPCLSSYGDMSFVEAKRKKYISISYALQSSTCCVVVTTWWMMHSRLLKKCPFSHPTLLQGQSSPYTLSDDGDWFQESLHGLSNLLDNMQNSGSFHPPIFNYGGHRTPFILFSRAPCTVPVPSYFEAALPDLRCLQAPGMQIQATHPPFLENFGLWHKFASHPRVV